MDSSRFLEVLKHIDLFEKFKPEPLSELVRASTLRTLDTDQVLFEYGSLGTSMYIVLEGRLLVYRNARVIATIHCNEYVGELAVIDPRPRSASAKALEPTTLLEIAASAFHRYLFNDPEAVNALLRVLAGRLRNVLDDTQAAYEGVNMLIHDMLNMITVLEGADLVAESLDEGNEWCFFLQPIARARKTLETLMRTALERARNRSVHYTKESVAIENVARTCLEEDLAQHPEVKRIHVKMETVGRLEPVVCHSIDVRRVLANLVINAAQAGATEVTVRLRQSGPSTFIDVIDNGPGIPKPVLGHIFEPHFTTKPNGNGLGLSSCREIIEKCHGGSLTCESTVGHGTTFTCEIPTGGLSNL